MSSEVVNLREHIFHLHSWKEEKNSCLTESMNELHSVPVPVTVLVMKGAMQHQYAWTSYDYIHIIHAKIRIKSYA